MFLAGALVVSGSFHYIASLSVLLLFSLYSLTTHASRRDAAVGLGVGMACFVGLAWRGCPTCATKDLWLSLALLVAAWAVGEVVRTRRDLQRDQVRAAITEERLRIARELHDVVAHSMSLIAVQAGVGAHVMPYGPGRRRAGARGHRRDQPEGARADPLHAGDAARGGPRTATAHRPRDSTTCRVLVEDVSAAGLDVDLVRSGTVPPLDATVSLTAYRIMQESLTNVIKHSAAATATVTVTRHRQAAGHRRPRPRPDAPHRAGSRPRGHGLVGLDERVRLVGGALTYGAAGRRLLRARRPCPPGSADDPGRRWSTTRTWCAQASCCSFDLRQGVEVVGEARDGLEAVTVCRRTAPDVVLMDVRMPHLDGLAATRTILADPACAQTRVLVLTTFDDDDLVLEALRSGASGFLLKETRPRPAARGDRGRRRRRGAAAPAGHPPADRTVRGAARRPRPRARRRSHRTRARGPARGVAGPVQPGDRRPSCTSATAP